MLNKFEQELKSLGLEEGLIDMVNLRDHVAQVHQGAPAELALQGSKLIKASLAGLKTLKAPVEAKVEFNEPVLILGGGLASYGAAQELMRRGIGTVMALPSADPEEEIRRLHDHYPGERQYHDRLRQIRRELDKSPLVKIISGGRVEKVLGRVGDYHVTFSFGEGQPEETFEVGAIIAALDGVTPGPGPGVRPRRGPGAEPAGNGRVSSGSRAPPTHRVVFWINDVEIDQPYGQLSARAAWHTASYHQGTSPPVHGVDSL